MTSNKSDTLNKSNTKNKEKVGTAYNPKLTFLLATLATLLWGSAFPCVKIGYKLWHIEAGNIATTILFAGIRFCVAGLLTLIGCNICKLDFAFSDFKSLKSSYLNKDFFKSCVIMSFFMTFFQYICFYIGLAHASGVNSSIINSSGTIFLVILAYVVYRTEKPSVVKILGCILSFGGIILISFKNTGISSKAFSSFSLQGEGLLILAALSFAVGNIVSKNYSSKYNPATLTGVQLTIGGLLLILVGASLGGTLKTVTLEGVLILVYLCALSAVAFTIWTILLKHNPASKVAVYNFLTPLFGVLLSGLMLGEDITSGYVIVSLALTCGGIVLMQAF